MFMSLKTFSMKMEPQIWLDLILSLLIKKILKEIQLFFCPKSDIPRKIFKQQYFSKISETILNAFLNGKQQPFLTFYEG